MPGVTTAYQNGIHSARPAANSGCILYACSTHSLIYRSDGSSWTTWMTIGSTTTTVATDAIWDAAGDLAVGTGADTAAKLTLGASGKAPFSNGSTLAYAYPPGYEFDYAEKTSDTSVTATTEGTANTVLTSGAVSYDGSTPILIDVYLPLCNPSGSASLVITLVDGGSAIGELGTWNTSAGIYAPFRAARRLTPSNASHTYGVEAYTGSGTATIFGGAGGAGTKMPGFIRQTKV